MENIKNYSINPEVLYQFNNNMDYCVGTGRMGLALQKEYFEQLKLVQEKIGFRHIRGHGLFHEDISVYQEYTDENGNICAEYNFTYLDMVIDSYLELNIRPFLELGFMPEKLSSDKNTIFWWKGNVTPPKDYKAWTALVQATLRHFIDRYGAAEATSWPVEVWNEPNLPGFWKNADMEEYFRLYDITSRAVKEVDGRLKVGGPAICGVEDDKWMRAFLEFCKKSQSPLDFITRHHYTIKFPERDGHYDYTELMEAGDDYNPLISTRNIVDSFEEYKGFPIHITEFNTSYTPKSPIHDTNKNAAYIAWLISKMGDLNESYSYWTFGDIFEEQGVPFTPFHGGFGLLANGRIPKPTFRTFQFFKQLEGNCVHRSEECVITVKDGKYRGVAWNKSGEKIELRFTFNGCDKKEYAIIEKHVDEKVCNPLKAWHDIGEPANPTKAQVELLRESANPAVRTGRIICAGNNMEYSLSVEKNAVVYFEVFASEIKSDRGYDYGRVTGLDK